MRRDTIFAYIKSQIQRESGKLSLYLHIIEIELTYVYD